MRTSVDVNRLDGAMGHYGPQPHPQTRGPSETHVSGRHCLVADLPLLLASIGFVACIVSGIVVSAWSPVAPCYSPRTALREM